MSQVVGGNYVRRTGDTMTGDLCLIPGKKVVVAKNDADSKIDKKLRQIAVRQLKLEGKLPADFE